MEEKEVFLTSKLATYQAFTLAEMYAKIRTLLDNTTRNIGPVSLSNFTEILQLLAPIEELVKEQVPAETIKRAFDNVNSDKVLDPAGLFRLDSEHEDFCIRSFPDLTDYRGPLRHMAEEVQEAIESGEADEFADILLLLLSAWRLRFPGGNVGDLVHTAFKKLEVNKTRRWLKLNSEGFSKHIDRMIQRDEDKRKNLIKSLQDLEYSNAEELADDVLANGWTIAQKTLILAYELSKDQIIDLGERLDISDFYKYFQTWFMTQSRSGARNYPENEVYQNKDLYDYMSNMRLNLYDRILHSWSE